MRLTTGLLLAVQFPGLTTPPTWTDVPAVPDQMTSFTYVPHCRSSVRHSAALRGPCSRHHNTLGLRFQGLHTSAVKRSCSLEGAARSRTTTSRRLTSFAATTTTCEQSKRRSGPSNASLASFAGSVKSQLALYTHRLTHDVATILQQAYCCASRSLDWA